MLDSNIFSWVIFPLLIFLARVIDVTLGTLRIIFVARGKRYIAPLLGFVEVFIWIAAVGQLVRNIANLSGYLAYAAGFAIGNYIGLLIEEKLAIGTLIIRVIVNRDAPQLVERLQAARFGVTSFDAIGSSGPVKVIYTVVKRKELPEVENILFTINPHFFSTVEEIRSARAGIFHPAVRSYRRRPFGQWYKRK